MGSAHGGLVHFSLTMSMASDLTRCVYLVGSGYIDHGERWPHGVAKQQLLAAVVPTAATLRDVGRPTGISSWPLHPTYFLSLSLPSQSPLSEQMAATRLGTREEQDLYRCGPQVHGGGFFSNTGSIHGQTAWGWWNNSWRCYPVEGAGRTRPWGWPSPSSILVGGA
jgi:hypothetical protein